MNLTKKPIEQLSDEQLVAETRLAYESHMLHDCSGSAYATWASGNHGAALRRRYYRLAAEMERRKLTDAT